MAFTSADHSWRILEFPLLTFHPASIWTIEVRLTSCNANSLGELLFVSFALISGEFFLFFFFFFFSFCPDLTVSGS